MKTSFSGYLIKSVILFVLMANPLFVISNDGTTPWSKSDLKNEMLNKRTRTAKHFSTDGKNNRAFISPASIHFLNDSQVWEDISTDIVPNSSSTHPYAAEKNSIKNYFPSNPFNNFLIMNAKEGSFKEKINAIKFLDASKNVISKLPISGNVMSSVNGNKIVYNGFHPDLSLSYSLGNDGRKFDLSILSSNFLNSIPAGAKYLAIEESFISDAPNSSLAFNDNQVSFSVNGNQVFGFAQPVAFDNNMRSEEKLEGKMSFLKTNDNTFLLSTEFALSWLTGTQRNFPVHLDPTVNYYPQIVAMWTGNQSSSAGKTSGYLRITLATTASWAKFDISTLPLGCFVQSANFWGYHYTTLGVKICEVRGLGNVEPVAAAAGALFTQSTTGPLYDNTYQFAGAAYQWNMSALGGSAPSDIAAAVTQGWFGLGFAYLSGSTTFAYVYGWDASPASYVPYLEVTYFTTPCSGAPAASTVMSPNYSICPTVNPGTLTLSNSYTTSGISYQWQMSTTGINGLYSNITTGTNAALPTGTLNNSTAYRAIITCSNGPASTTSTPVMISVGPPAISNAVSALPLLCPGMGSSLSLGAQYQGVSYQWQTSSVSIVGPYFNVVTGTNAATSGTLSTYVSPSFTNFAFFQAVLTCTAAPSLTSISLPFGVNIAGTTTSVVPYMEDFEGVGVDNFLPNCSWSASSPTLVNQTYILSNTANRTPYNGAKFGAFKSPTSPNGDYFYTNGIQLEPGITYSASVWYTTDGALGWNNLELLVGTSQSVGSLTNIATANSGVMINTYYKNLSNTFTVAASGLYYVAVKAIGSGAAYLSFDDLSITAPCSLNSPSVSISGLNSGCIGQNIILTASGADTYTWNGTVYTPTLNYFVTGNAVVPLVGRNTASGCSTTTNIAITANPSPVVGILAPNTTVCKGSSVMLTAYGAFSYNWTTGANTATVVVSPTVTASYTVIGVNSYGCSSSVAQQITAKNLPVVAAIASNNQMCTGETVTLTATGASSYTWASNNSFIVGANVVVSPFVSTTYTVTGTDTFGCQGNAYTALAVSGCVGITENLANNNGLSLYPNPCVEEFTLEFNSDGAKVIEIYDLTGRSIITAHTSEASLTIKMNNYAKGIYYVKVNSEAGLSVKRFVKE